MAGNLDKAAKDFMSSADGRRLAGKKGDIERLAFSSDGQRVKAMLQNNGIENALERGDMDAVKSTLSDVLKTSEGTRLMSALQNMLGKN